jgi:hypothetical protein
VLARLACCRTSGVARGRTGREAGGRSAGSWLLAGAGSGGPGCRHQRYRAARIETIQSCQCEKCERASRKESQRNERPADFLAPTRVVGRIPEITGSGDRSTSLTFCMPWPRGSHSRQRTTRGPGRFARYYAERSPKSTRERVLHTLRLLAELIRATDGDLSVRLTTHPLAIGLISVDGNADSRSEASALFAEYYTYQAHGEPSSYSPQMANGSRTSTRKLKRFGLVPQPTS